MTPHSHRPRIGYVTATDSLDRRSWSGIHYFMSRALQRNCGEVCHLGPLNPPTRRLLAMFARKVQRLTGRVYNPLHTFLLARSYARLVERRVTAARCDVVFAPAGSTEIALVGLSVPIVYLSDATFALMHNYYPSFSNLLSVSAWEGNRIERRAIRNSSIAIFATEWAAESARRDYGADPAKTHVIPFGANLEEVPNREDALGRRRSSGCRMLFVGADWKRKGGDIAFDTLIALEKRGVMAELVVCGCRPPEGLEHPRVTVIPFLDKSEPAQRVRLTRLLSSADFFVLPTRAECSGIVFCEANAFGLPVIATDTGGTSCVVEDGRSGVLLPLSAGGEEYADMILALSRDESRYRALVEGGRSAFDARLNWDAWGERVAAVLACLGREARATAHPAEGP